MLRREILHCAGFFSAKVFWQKNGGKVTKPHRRARSTATQVPANAGLAKTRQMCDGGILSNLRAIPREGAGHEASGAKHAKAADGDVLVASMPAGWASVPMVVDNLSKSCSAGVRAPSDH
jgi:hypothetical protein